VLLGQLQELANPFWYIHWIGVQSFAHKDARFRTPFFVNAFVIMFLYIALRLVWVLPWLPWMMQNYSFIPAFLSVFGPVMNVSSQESLSI
jgi:NhaP-type Na+/H+ or K+/H+ antiporter